MEYQELSKEKLIEELGKRDNTIEALQDENRTLERDSISDEESIENLQLELDDALDVVSNIEAKTMLGELKVEILKKIRHLNLSQLQEIEEKYCQNILGTEQIID